MELLKLSSHQEIANIVQKKNLPLSFFASPHMLHTFFNNRGFDLWCVSYQENDYIVVRKIDREFGNNEIRLLFEIFPEEVVDFLKKKFDPPFIAYNELFMDPRKENQIEGVDVIVDLSKYVHLEDKNIRKHYRQAVRRNANLMFKDFDKEALEKLPAFWEQWLKDRADRPFAADRTHNDARFFNEYTLDQYFGIAVYDGEKLVGYSIGVGVTATGCISAFNKCLRGYTNLGLQLSYEKARQVFEKGFTYMSIGGINNDFKKQFLHIAHQDPYYGFELERKESFKTRTPNGYTHALFF